MNKSKRKRSKAEVKAIRKHYATIVPKKDRTNWQVRWVKDYALRKGKTSGTHPAIIIGNNNGEYALLGATQEPRTDRKKNIPLNDNLELNTKANASDKAVTSYVVPSVRTRTRENTGSPIDCNVFVLEMDNKKPLKEIKQY